MGIGKSKSLAEAAGIIRHRNKWARIQWQGTLARQFGMRESDNPYKPKSTFGLAFTYWRKGWMIENERIRLEKGLKRTAPGRELGEETWEKIPLKPIPKEGKYWLNPPSYFQKTPKRVRYMYQNLPKRKPPGSTR